MTRGICCRRSSGPFEILNWEPLASRAVLLEYDIGHSMKANKNYFDQIRGLISEGKVDEAVKELNQLFRHTPEWNKVIQQSFRWKDLAGQIRDGLVSYDNAVATKNQIVQSLLALISELETSFSKQSGTSLAEEIKKAISLCVKDSENVVANSDITAAGNVHIGKKETTIIQEQHIHYGTSGEEVSAKPQNPQRGAYFQLSCDRREIKVKFNQICDDLREGQDKHHLFFIEGKIKGQAASLVKRLKVDLVELEHKVGPAFNLEELINPVVTVSVDGRLSPEDLIYGMRKDFNRIYGIRPEVHSMAQLAGRIHQIKDFQSQDYLIFDIDISFNVSLWDKEVKKVLDWLIDEFSDPGHPAEQQYFLFFVILNQKFANDVKSRGLFSWLSKRQVEPAFDLRKVLEEYLGQKTNVSLLPPLTKVLLSDLEEWFKQIADTEVDPVEAAQKLSKKLPGKEPWDMHDVEQELRKIIDEYRSELKKI